MNIMDLNNINHDCGFSLTESTTPDTDRLLEEVSKARIGGADGKDRPSDVSIALETLNNVLKTFNTIAGMNVKQAHEPMEPDGDPQADTGADATFSGNNGSEKQAPAETSDVCGQINTNKEETQETSPTDILPTEPNLATEVVSGGQGKAEQDTLEQDKPATRQAGGSGRHPKTGMGRTTKEMIRETEGRMWFIPAKDSDSDKLQYFKRIKQAVSVFSTYHDLICHLYEYQKAGNVIESEVYFLFRCAYIFEGLEKYHSFFRNSMFKENSLAAGYKYMIDDVLDSITDISE